jgi:hypothetical protein
VTSKGNLSAPRTLTELVEPLGGIYIATILIYFADILEVLC